jgi:hypothetical protein
VIGKRDTPRRKRPELFANVQRKEGADQQPEGGISQSRPKAFKRERQINPDTQLPFRDPRSRVLPCGRVICRGSDMQGLRERVGRREGEICQRCEAWCPVYPPEGFQPGEMHHVFGRGMGGGKRNDIAAEQEWLCGGPAGCHAAAKIKRRFYSGIPDTEGEV